MDIDMQTEEVLQMISEGARLSVNLINHVLSNLADSLEKDGNESFIDKSTREGKQKINNLIKKHKDGVKTLDENLTKEQVKDYQKELKKLGVDFSVVKNEKDNYSFFFAGAQAEVIEKALRNVVELKSRVMNDDRVKQAKLNLDAESNDMSEKEIENANKAYSQYVDRIEGNEIPETQHLNEKEKNLFNKIKILDETGKEVQQEVQQEIEKSSLKNIEGTDKSVEDQIDNVDTEISKLNNIKENLPINNEVAKEIESNENTKDNSKKVLNEKISQLSDKELSLFEKRMEYENIATAPAFDERESYKLADELTELKSSFSKESIDKVNSIDKDIRSHDNSNEISKGEKLNANEILKETKKHSSERKAERKKEQKYSIDNVKKIDNKINNKEKDEKKINRNNKVEHTL